MMDFDGVGWGEGNGLFVDWRVGYVHVHGELRSLCVGQIAGQRLLCSGLYCYSNGRLSECRIKQTSVLRTICLIYYLQYIHTFRCPTLSSAQEPPFSSRTSSFHFILVIRDSI